MQTSTPLLLAGAGPFGLALAAYLKHEKIEHTHIGSSMDYWKSYMPKKMFLRSACDWHLDPFNEATILNYLDTLNLKPADVEPLSPTPTPVALSSTPAVSSRTTPWRLEPVWSLSSLAHSCFFRRDRITTVL